MCDPYSLSVFSTSSSAARLPNSNAAVRTSALVLPMPSTFRMLKELTRLRPLKLSKVTNNSSATFLTFLPWIPEPRTIASSSVVVIPAGPS